MNRPADINDLLAVTEDTVFLTVVGVVGDVTLHDMTEAGQAVGTYYFPMSQSTPRLLTFAVKTAGSTDSIPAALRTTLASLDPELPLYDVKTMDERTEGALLNRRSPALLSLSFGALALLLSAVGIYGVLAHLVTQRTKEIGIRLALGGTGRSIFHLVLRESLLLVGLGLLVGAGGALALRQSLESQFFGIQPGDPMVVGSVTLLAGRRRDDRLCHPGAPCDPDRSDVRTRRVASDRDESRSREARTAHDDASRTVPLCVLRGSVGAVYRPWLFLAASLEGVLHAEHRRDLRAQPGVVQREQYVRVDQQLAHDVELEADRATPLAERRVSERDVGEHLAVLRHEVLRHQLGSVDEPLSQDVERQGEARRHAEVGAEGQQRPVRQVARLARFGVAGQDAGAVPLVGGVHVGRHDSVRVGPD